MQIQQYFPLPSSEDLLIWGNTDIDLLSSLEITFSIERDILPEGSLLLSCDKVFLKLQYFGLWLVIYSMSLTNFDSQCTHTWGASDGSCGKLGLPWLWRPGKLFSFALVSLSLSLGSSVVLGIGLLTLIFETSLGVCWERLGVKGCSDGLGSVADILDCRFTIFLEFWLSLWLTLLLLNFLSFFWSSGCFFFGTLKTAF